MPLSGLNVLIAEDEAMVLMGLEDAVQKAGARQVLTVRTCSQALKIAKADEIDIALLDINLADCEVYEAASVLQEKQIPFAFYSGRARRDMVSVQFPKAGWISKPSSDEEIISELSRLVVG